MNTLPQTNRPNREETFVRPAQSFLVRLGKRLRNPVNAFLAHQSLIPDTPVIPADYLPELAISHRQWQEIRDEAVRLLAGGREEVPPFGKISPDHRRIASGPQWKSFFFAGYGFRSARARHLCPQTARWLDRLPGLVVGFFSIMDGDTHVPRHRGLTKAWLNCHLPLVVPTAPGRCEIRIADRCYRWREGEWLVFDETCPHEVWNDTGEQRVVLMLQLRRPMRWPGRALASIIFRFVRRSSFVQDVRRALRIA